MFVKEKKEKKKGINQSPEIYGLNPWILVQVVGFFLCWSSRKQPTRCPCRAMEDSPVEELPCPPALSPGPARAHGWPHPAARVRGQQLAAQRRGHPNICWKPLPPNSCSASGKQRPSLQREAGAAESRARFCDDGCSLPASFDELNLPPLPSTAGIICLAGKTLWMKKHFKKG